MLVQLVGIQKIDFVGTKGEKINGKNLYVLYEDENVQGYRTDKYYLKDGIDLPKETKLNEKIDLRFNNRGKVESVYKVN